MIPLAATAAVVAIVVGATTLTSHGGPRRGSGATGSRTASPAPSWTPAPPGPGSSLIKGSTVLSAIIPIRLVTGRQVTWTFIWFSHLNSGSDQGIQLCSVTDGGGYYGSGGCATPGFQAQQGFVEGTNTIKLIVSDQQVTSLTAQLPHGRSVSGVSGWGRGFPDKVWLVNFPEEDNATLALRNAAGQVVKRLSVKDQYPIPSQPHSGGIKLFRYPAGPVFAEGRHDDVLPAEWEPRRS